MDQVITNEFGFRHACLFRQSGKRFIFFRSESVSYTHLAEQRRDRHLVGELGAVVGEDGAEHAARPVGAEDGPDALQGVRDDNRTV